MQLSVPQYSYIALSVGNACCFILICKTPPLPKLNQTINPQNNKKPTAFSIEWENLIVSFLPLGLYDVKGC